jgi:mono/diheme cytochrome c family protein
MMVTTAKATIGVFLAALVLLLGVSAATAQQSAPRRPTGDAAHGKVLFFEHGCYSCHGYNGDARTGANLTRPAGILASETAFIKFLRMRADSAPLLPSSQMPNFSKADISDEDAKDIYAYIRTFSPDAPAVKDVPLLESILSDAKNRPAQ